MGKDLVVVIYLLLLFIFAVLKLLKEGAGQKKQSGQCKDERPGRGNVVGPQPASYKSFGISRKDKEFIFDSKDQQVQTQWLNSSSNH